jgi:hypothetical protein
MPSSEAMLGKESLMLHFTQDGVKIREWSLGYGSSCPVSFGKKSEGFRQ